MKINIGTRTIRQDIIANVSPCPCCGSKDVDAGSRYTGNGCDCFTGYGFVVCNSCGHKITRESHNIGYGDSEESLARCAISEWNSQHASSGKQGLFDEIASLKKENDRLKEENERLKEMMANHSFQFDFPILGQPIRSFYKI